jgi:hypothetical protein
MTTATQSYPVHQATNGDAHTRLHGRALFFARALWFITLALVLGLYTLSVPLQAQVLQTACANNCQFGQISAEKMQELQQLGLSLNFYVGYNIALDTIFFLVFVAVGTIVFWRKSNDWFGIYVALSLVLFGIGFSNPLLLIGEQYPTFYVPLLVLNGIGSTMIGVFFYLFPDGRFVPRWTRWLIPFVAAREFANIFSPHFSSSLFGTTAFSIELASFLIAQIYRYRRASNAIERQQTKWFVYGATVGLVGFFGLILFVGLISPRGQPTSVLVDLIGGAALFFFVLLVPFSIMMAILRYRLWDIDILINRTLVYVPLTALLAGLFAASVALLQRVLIAATGQGSDLAAVLGTLLVVAALTPVKDRLQTTVDRRFKGGNDPAQKLNAFQEQIRTRFYTINPLQVTRRMTEAAMGAFNSKGGAVFWGEEKQPSYTCGEWDGEIQLSAAVASREHKYGVAALSARRNGQRYNELDRATLERVASFVAQVIEQDSPAPISDHIS